MLVPCGLQAEDDGAALPSHHSGSSEMGSSVHQGVQLLSTPQQPVFVATEAQQQQQQQQQHAHGNGFAPLHESVAEPLTAQQASAQTASQPLTDVITLSKYLSMRHSANSSAKGFRIFCAVLSFLRNTHASGTAAHSVRPSQLLLHRSGQITLQRTLPVPPIEAELYTSPEEASRGTPSLASDIFALGMLFFELVNPVQDQQARLAILRGVRQRVLPPDFMDQHRSHETAFLMALIHPDAGKRPSVAQIVSSNLLNMLRSSFQSGNQGSSHPTQQQQQQPQPQAQAQAQAQVIGQQLQRLTGGDQHKHQHHSRQQDQPAHHHAPAPPQPTAGVDSTTLLDFLSIMRKNTLNALQKTEHQLGYLDSDVREVNTNLLALQCQQGTADRPGPHGLQDQSSAPLSLLSRPALELQHPASRKRQRSWESDSAGPLDVTPAELRQASRKQSRISQSCLNMERAFSDLESNFFKRRDSSAVHVRANSADLSDGSHVDLPGLAGLSDHLTDFSSDLIDFSRYSQLKVSSHQLLHAW